MYVWIWRKLPGGLAGKIGGSLVLLFAVVALLFLVVFPWASPRLPFNHVTVDTPQSPPSQVQQTDRPATPT
jgi:hypothetical protein